MKAWVSKLQSLLRKHRIILLDLNLALTTILFICSLNERFELILTPRSVDEAMECNRLLFITYWTGLNDMRPTLIMVTFTISQLELPGR